MDGIRWAWMPLLAILLSSCGIPEHRDAEPWRDLPGSFNGMDSDENSSQIPIEEFFSDPILTGMMEEGLIGNQELKILAQDIQVANNDIWAKTGAYLPFITIGGGAGLRKPSFYTPLGAVDDQLLAANGTPFPTPLPMFLASTDLTWQIDIWRQLRNSRDAASLRYLGTVEGRNYVITRFVAEVADNYYQLMALDKRMENLNTIIELQERSLEIAIAQFEGARATDLGVQRFRAEVRKNQSEKLIVQQEIIEAENRINFLLGRFPQSVPRSTQFFDQSIHSLALGVPAEMLQNRPDVRAAERILESTGLDVEVAKANFYPRVDISSGVGYEAFNMRYLFQSPESLVYNVAGNAVAPLINKRAIQAEYMNANARQLQACYNYQRTILTAFTEVINRINKVHNYTTSIDIKKEQLKALEASVDVATKLFNAGRVEYIDVLFAQRDLRDARMVLIDTKQEQLTAIVDTYQALGGGLVTNGLSQASIGPVEPAAMPPEPAEALPDAPADGMAPDQDSTDGTSSDEAPAPGNDLP